MLYLKIFTKVLRWLFYRKCPNGHWFNIKKANWSHEEFEFDNSDYPLCTKCGEATA